MDKKIDFNVRIQSGIVILDLCRSFDYESIPHFRRIIYVLVKQKVSHIILNLNKLTFMDSTGLGSLIAATRFVYQQGGKFTLVVGAVRIQRIFENVKTDKVLPLYGTEKEAVENILDRNISPPQNILEKIDGFFNPVKGHGAEEIITRRKEFFLKKGIPVYVDLIGKTTASRENGKIEKIMEGETGIIIRTETEIREDNPYCMVTYFVNKKWFEFEDYPFRVENRKLWFHYPSVVTQVERRTGIRIRYDLPVRFQICDVVGSSKEYEGTSVNLGASGMLLKTREAFPICDCVGLRFQLPGIREEITTVCRVVRKSRPNEKDYYLGVHFLIINDRLRKDLRLFEKRQISKVSR